MIKAIISERAIDITYQRERFDLYAPDFARWMELFQAHADELRKFGVLQLNIDSERYLDLQRENRLFLFGARVDGVLQGYSSYFTHRHLHYRHVWVGQDDAQFVVPELRRLGIGRQLRELNMAAMKEAGVKFVTARDKYEHEHDESLSEMGFVLWERCHAKVL